MIMGCEFFHYFWALLKIQTHMNVFHKCIQNLKLKTWIKFINELENNPINFKTFISIHNTFIVGINVATFVINMTTFWPIWFLVSPYK
jgi:hypothetical protein